MTQPARTSSPASSSRTAWSANDLRGSPHDVHDKAERVQRMFNAIAGRYDLNNRLHSFGRDQAWRRTAVRLCGVRATDHVLDVACGTGDLAEAFAAARPATVTGLDFATSMLELARTKAGRGPRQDRPAPTYVQGDAMDLPFDDGRFDIVSIAFGIRNVADPAIAIREFRRVLRPGGRLVILEFSEPDLPVIRTLSRIYTRHIMPITAGLIAGDHVGAYRYLPASVNTFIDRDALVAALTAVGLERVTAHPLTFGVCVAYLGHVPAA